MKGGRGSGACGCMHVLVLHIIVPLKFTKCYHIKYKYMARHKQRGPERESIPRQDAQKN